MPETARQFVAACNAQNTPWRAAWAAEVLPAPGNACLIPDYRFTHAETGRTAYLERLPHGSRERLTRRLHLLEAAGRTDYLLACPHKALPESPPSWVVPVRRTLTPTAVKAALKALGP